MTNHHLTNTDKIPRLALCPGEPAGIGPELCLAIAGNAHPAQLVLFADIDYLGELCNQLALPIRLREFNPETPASLHKAGEIPVFHLPLATSVTPGTPNPDNAPHLLQALRTATDKCLDGSFDALVTGPVDKSIINQAGYAFSGHTGFLAEITKTPQVVMLLATDHLKVALATDHLPLKQVPATLTLSYVRSVIQITHREISRLYGIENPTLLICGLNPHAGEGGFLGREEEESIRPAIQQLRSSGMNLEGPLPADSLFTPEKIHTADAVIAMYHDQGLPVLKSQGFGEAVNITLGLPIIRTSVDHGTAYALVGTGRAKKSSLEKAILTAIEFCHATQTP